MAGDLGYLISPTAVGFIAESASFPTAYLVAAVPAFLVFFAALTLKRSRTSPDEQQTPEPSAPVG